MNKIILKQRASELKEIGERYASENGEAKKFLNLMMSLIDQAISEKISAPLTWSDIPGALYFSEGTLQKFPELENAYSKFCIELTGGEKAGLTLLKMKMQNIHKE